VLSEDKIKEIYHDLAPKLTNYLVASGMDYASACDITQECFIRLWKKREAIGERDSVSGFIFAMAKNLKIDRYRRNKFIIFQEELNEESCGSTEQSVNEDNLIYLRRRLSQALNTLPENLREAYTLFQIAGRSIKEIARITGTSESNVKVRIHRAKEKLTVLLQDLQ
jgi:RNA polymerase sigma-70 factor (ECF subfamily)